jgi:hypothetical protein
MEKKRKGRIDHEWLSVIGYILLLLGLRYFEWIKLEGLVFAGVTFPIIFFLYIRHRRALAGLKINVGAVSVETPPNEDKKEVDK